MPVSSDIKVRLANADWEREMKVGLGHARKFELGYRLFPVSIAEDIMQDAMVKIISGERVWKDPKRVTLGGLIFGTIRSLYSNEIRKALNAPYSEEYDDERGESEAPTAEEAVAIKSQIGQVVQQLHLRRPDLYDFLHLCEEHGLFEDGRESKDVAADMNMSASNFSKTKKKLVEFLTELHAELSGFGT